MRLTKQQHQKITNQYLQGLSSTLLARQYSVSDTAILQILRKYKIPRTHPNKKISDDIVNAMIQEYNAGKGTTTISKKFKCDTKTVYRHLYQNNVLMKSHSFYRTYKVNERYFQFIDIFEKAYWLGFLMADGCILRHSNGNIIGVKIKLQKRDIAQIFALRTTLKTDMPVRLFNEKSFSQCQLLVYSPTLAYDLISHGCVPAKSLILKFPEKLNPDLYSHFIRGYFDGDGSVMVNANNNQKYIEFAGTLEFLQKVQEILMISCGLAKNDIHQKGNIYLFRYGGNRQILKIRDYLYKDANIYLERKYQKFF